MRDRWVLLLAFSLCLSVAWAQTVTKTITYAPVTQWTDNTPITVPVTYDLEHRLCGQSTWALVVGGLPAPSSTRNIDAQCHEYTYVAVAGGVRSVEGPATKLDFTPIPVPKTPKAPQPL